MVVGETAGDGDEHHEGDQTGGGESGDDEWEELVLRGKEWLVGGG